MFDKKTYKLLKKLYSCEKISEEEIGVFLDEEIHDHMNPHISFLRENHLISVNYEDGKPDGAGGLIDGILFYKITLKGRAFIEKKRKELFQFWFPYIVTTIVAIAGLLVAIAGLLQDRVQNQVQNIDTKDSVRIQVQMSGNHTVDIQYVCN